MRTDTSDGALAKAGEYGESGVETEAAPRAALAAVCSLRFRGTLFGSTLARVFTAVDRLQVGEIVSISTNDP